MTVTPPTARNLRPLPVTFVEDIGQLKKAVRMHARGARHSICLAPGEVQVVLRGESTGVAGDRPGDSECGRPGGVSVRVGDPADAFMTRIDTSPSPRGVSLPTLEVEWDEGS